MYSFSFFLPLSDDGGANNPSGAGLERSQHELLVHGHSCRGRIQIVTQSEFIDLY